MQVKAGANNQAYTAGPLPLHCDLPFYEHPPAVQMLHCIKQNNGAGGASIFSDGLAAAEALSKSDPTGFELLCTLPVLYDDLDPREQKDRRCVCVCARERGRGRERQSLHSLLPLPLT